MKYLITGHGGFVGSYLIDYIIQQESDAEIIGLDIAARKMKADYFTEYIVDLLDADKLNSVLKKVKPDYIMHLASFSSVAYSWEYPLESFQNNTNIFLNLLDGICRYCPECKLLSIGSSEEYGAVSEDDIPLKETMIPRPLSPYAVARVAQENMSRVYSRGFGLNIVCTRSFNHIGCGQLDKFVISSLAKRFAMFNAGQCSEIVTGDTSVIRDFLDVRDVVRAYFLLLKSDGGNSEIYNICSGFGTSIQNIIDLLCKITNTMPSFRVDSKLLRPVENRIVTGSYEKINKLCGWKPEITLEDSITSIVEWWQKRI